MNPFVRRGWLAIISCAVATFNSGALFFGYPGLMTPYWQDTFHADTAATGFVMTFACFGVGCMTLLAGRIHAKVGTRHSFLIGAIILTLCMVLANLANSMPLIYLWAFLNGSGTGFIYMPSLTTVQRWFPHRRGLVTGVVNLCFGMSAAIMSPIYSYMLEHLGYKTMNYVLLALVVVINAGALLGSELPEYTALTPEQEQGREEILTQMRQKSAGRGPAMTSRDYTGKEAVRTRSFWMVWLTWAFVGAAGISMVSQGGNFAGSIALPGVIVITSFNLTNGFSRIIAGTLSDYIGRNTTGCFAFLLGAVGYFLLPFSRSAVLVGILAAFVGFSFGTLFAISAPLLSDLFGLEHYSTIFSLIFVAYGFISGIFGPALVGRLLKMTGGNYAVVFPMLAVFCLLGAVCIILAKVFQRNVGSTQ